MLFRCGATGCGPSMVSWRALQPCVISCATRPSPFSLQLCTLRPSSAALAFGGMACLQAHRAATPSSPSSGGFKAPQSPPVTWVRASWQNRVAGALFLIGGAWCRGNGLLLGGFVLAEGLQTMVVRRVGRPHPCFNLAAGTLAGPRACFFATHSSAQCPGNLACPWPRG